MGIVIIRTALLYITIIAAVRFMGKRQISDLQTSELVVTMLLSDIASMAAQNTSQPLMSGIVPMIVLVTAEVILSGAMLKFSFLRKLICGNSLVVISDGALNDSALKICGVDRTYITNILKKKNLNEKDIFVMTMNRLRKYKISATNGKKYESN